jgi:dephospho-CoA kinase
MLKVGLTGNMGSGKSIVAEIFRVLGVPVYHADAEARNFLNDPQVVQKIRERLGGNLSDKAGSIDRAVLSERVFSDPDALSFLNSLIHPLVREDFAKWCLTRQEFPYVIHEAAILYESGFAGEFDRIICVSAPKEESIRRIRERDGTSREQILKRMQFQMDGDKKAALADFVIRNGGPEMLLPQVLTIHGILSESTP